MFFPTTSMVIVLPDGELPKVNVGLGFSAEAIVVTETVNEKTMIDTKNSLISFFKTKYPLFNLLILRNK
jgi:hypothetical protein